ncbi:MAG TPA: vitamin K epoxide reductase family protein, partial [Phycisphaerae bacterium]
MKRVSVRVVLVVILSMWGAYVSAHLLERHYFRSGKTWFSAVCDATGGGCDTVLDSRWAYFPPRPEEEERGAAGPAEPTEEAVEPTSQPASAPASASASQPASAPASQATSQPTTQPASAQRRPELHIPVAFLGLAYFSALGLWFVCVGRPNSAARRWQLLPVIVSALGLLGSIAFIVIMYTQVKAWCAWCLVTHATNALIFPLIVWLYPRRPPEQQATVEVEVLGEAGPSLINTVAPAPHPSVRLGCVTLFTIVMAVLCEAFWVNSMALTRESREYQRVLADFLKDGESLYAAYQRAPRFDIK